MEGSSNALLISNVSNFVSVKLSGDHKYPLWKAQMLCLLDGNNMRGIVDSGTENMSQYDSIVKGWIFGSVSEDILAVVYDLGSAKAVWETLKSIYDPDISFQEVNEKGIERKLQQSDAKTEKEDVVVSTEMSTIQEGADSIEIVVSKDMVSTETQTKNEDTEKREKKIKHKRKLRAATMKGDWSKVESILKKDEGLATEALGSYGSTILHTAVGTGHNHIVENLFAYINEKQVLEKRHSDGSTALHIAAIVGNKDAAELLVEKNSELLRIKDKDKKEPLHRAYEKMHLDTIGYLLEAVNNDDKNKSQSSMTNSIHPAEEIGVDLLVNTISAKRYGLAKRLVKQFPTFASKSDDALMALAKTFPSGLDYWEALLYPSLDGIKEALSTTAWLSIKLFGVPAYMVYEFFTNMKEYEYQIGSLLITLAIVTVPSMLASAIAFICLVILAICFIFLFLYSIGWKVAKILFAPINQIENKKKEWDEAQIVLELVCDEIDKLPYLGTHHQYYTRPIHEAARQNAYEVVDEILYRSPDSIESKDKSGYDIIQLAIINRSEKIYNLIYDIGERKNLYRTYKDSFQNNILHLAGKLAPSGVLNQRTGAALQLQRELQWLEEVQKFVFPTFITQENIFKETPDMVFSREHKKLVKEGEKWMKTTAESCSITAALITTIVFAAAITVPGGSNQESGTPLFDKKIAFIIFAITDAISLFSSSTALLVFLSILTARFAEKDFLVSLPRRLFIGLFSLVLSTTTMMVAFSATLFLVFSDEKIWMLAPICGLAFIPIASFVVLQFPLMVDLFRSTYIRTFGKQRKNILRRFNPDDIRLRFGTDRGAAAREKKKNEKQKTQANPQMERDLPQE